MWHPHIEDPSFVSYKMLLLVGFPIIEPLNTSSCHVDLQIAAPPLCIILTVPLQTLWLRILLLNRGMANGSVIILWASHKFWQVIASQKMSTVLLSKVIQLPGKHWFDLENRQKGN